MKLALFFLSLLVLAGCTNNQGIQPIGNNDQVEPEVTSEPTGSALIQVFSPLPNQVVTLPLTVTGEARGNWYFEADFPVRLLDLEGNELAVAIAQAQDDWMTEAFVPFIAIIEAEDILPQDALLVLEKDNPSGLPEQDDSITIPVTIR
jgi:hypothetical protein